MAYLLKQGEGKDIPPVPAGTHHGICVGFYDVGTQPSNNPQYEASKQVILTFEIPDERLELEKDGKKSNLPRNTSVFFNASFGGKKPSRLRTFAEGWRGRPFSAEELKGFDPKNMLGVNALLTIIHKPKASGGISAVITSAAPLMRGMAKRVAEGPLTFFSTLEECARPIGEPFEFEPNMPEFIMKMCEQSEEYQARKNPPVAKAGVPRNEAEAANQAADEATLDPLPF